MCVCVKRDLTDSPQIFLALLLDVVPHCSLPEQVVNSAHIFAEGTFVGGDNSSVGVDTEMVASKYGMSRAAWVQRVSCHTLNLRPDPLGLGCISYYAVGRLAHIAVATKSQCGRSASIRLTPSEFSTKSFGLRHRDEQCFSHLVCAEGKQIDLPAL